MCTHVAAAAEPAAPDFCLPDDDAAAAQFYTGVSTPLERYRANIAAIATLKRLDARGCQSGDLTDDERVTLARYAGWGDKDTLDRLMQAGPFYRESDDARGLLSHEERRGVKASSLNAHFTPVDIARAIYRALIATGIHEQPGLRILEPAAGCGNFLAAMPAWFAAGANRFAVELDSVSAQILRHLYPQTTVLHSGLEAAELPNNWFDLVVSNFPFGNYPVHDPAIREKYLRAAIHDYFFVKSLALTRPGGIVAAITSRYTLDKLGSRIRRYLHTQAELLAAVRLPSNAFRANAGTAVITDVLVFRRRLEPLVGEDASLPAWVGVEDLFKIDGEFVQVNRLFVQWPELMLGQPGIGRGMYGRDELILPYQGQDLPGDLAAALTRQIAEAQAARLAPVMRPMEEGALPVSVNPLGVDVEAIADDARRNRAERLLDLYAKGKRVIETQAEDLSDDEIADAQALLLGAYQAFVSAHGPVNQKHIFQDFDKSSPVAPFVRALEIPDGKAWQSAPIFTQRTIRPLRRPQGTYTAQDALYFTLNETGRLDLSRIAALAGKPEADVIEDLAGRIFQNVSGEWLLAEEYLSGNVREKHRQAVRAARYDPGYAANVGALEAALPKWLDHHEIAVRLGAGWIPTDVIRDFVRSLVRTYHGNVSHTPVLGLWKLDRANFGGSVYNTVTWGTNRAPALSLIEDALNLRTALVMDTRFDGSSVVNETETVAAQAKQDAIREEFARWIWADEGRRARLVEIYNNTHNCFRARRYDGSHLQLPGMNAAIKLMPHQLDGIARVLQSPATLLGHCVGAGKTYLMVAAAMELKRLGIAYKALVVAPNGLSEQWAKMARELYPAASVFAPTPDELSAGKRSELLSRIATGAWDIVIIPHSAFKLLPLNPKTVCEYIEREIEELSAYLEGLPTGHQEAKSRKDIEKAIKRLQVKLADMLKAIKKDNHRTITFEELGIGVLFVDEAHLYKNLYCPTKMRSVAGLPGRDSQRALDCFIKTRWMLDRGRRVVFATATPISNTVAEVYVMMKFLQLDLLQEHDLHHFDAWVQTFADTSQVLEMRPDGSGFAMKTRFNRFGNLPELAALWRQALDVKNADQLSLPRPRIFGGAPQVVTIPASKELKDFVQSLVRRVEKIKKRTVEPWQDNMLAVTTDGRKAALDVRLVQPDARVAGETKVSAVAEQVYRCYLESAEQRGAQVVYCDLGVPALGKNKEGEEEASLAESETDALARDSVYGEIKRALVAKGIPEEEIFYIQRCRNPKEKSAAFARINAGEIRVLLASTETAGMGANFQERLYALHHLTPTFKPSEIEQREGRIVRQGNVFPEVRIFTYVTEGSFDAFMWSLIEQKARFISQIMAGEITARSAEDVDQLTMTAAQVKAIASGNPKILEKVALDVQVTKLERVYTVWRDQRQQMRRQLEDAPARLKDLAFKIEGYGRAIQTRDAYGDQDFVIVLKHAYDGGNAQITFEERSDAGVHLRQLSFGCGKVANRQGVTQAGVVGEYRGFEVVTTANAHRKGSVYAEDLGMSLRVPGTQYAIAFNLTLSDAGIIQSADMQLANLEDRLADAQRNLATIEARMRSIEVELESGWEHADKYQQLRARLAALNAELVAQGEKVEDAPTEFASLEADALKPVVTHRLESLDANAPAEVVAVASDAVAVAALTDEAPKPARVAKARAAAARATRSAGQMSLFEGVGL